MSDVVQLDIVTPEKLYLSKEATLVEVPGEEGDFGVLPGHAPLISSLRAGVVTVYGPGTDKKYYFVVGGVAEVTPERCVILAEHVEDLATCNKDSVEKRLADARAMLAAAIAEEDTREAHRELLIAENLLQAVSVIRH